MGGGLAGGPLAAAVAKAGGLGTLGLAGPGQLREAIKHVRDEAPGRAVAVNLLMHFARRSHIAVCVDERVEVVVVAFGGDRGVVEHLRAAGIFVFVMVGTEAQARQAIGWGADGLIAQGREAGGHLVGTVPALEFLPRVRAVADRRPVFVAGGIAAGADTRRALDIGADGVVAETRFLMTREANAHPDYQRRILDAEMTMETTLFGLSWPLRHRVIPNAATRRWCRSDGTAKALPAALNAGGRWLAVLGYFDAGALIRFQSPRLPVFTPLAPLKDLQHLLSADFTRIAVATLLIVGIVLILLLRAVVAPLYLLSTVVLNYLAALGIGVLVFQFGLGHEIAWPVPLLAFILLVAVGADYNMLVISRLREESTSNTRVGVLRTVASTGSVITSAGLIFAASMFGLTIGSVDIMVQAGLIIGCGLLLDTFVVRTLTVPALATLLGENSWWPELRRRR